MIYENEGVGQNPNSQIMESINNNKHVIVELVNKSDKNDVIELVRENERVGIIFPDETVFIYRIEKIEGVLEDLGITEENFYVIDGRIEE